MYLIKCHYESMNFNMFNMFYPIAIVPLLIVQIAPVLVKRSHFQLVLETLNTSLLSGLKRCSDTLPLLVPDLESTFHQ